MTRNIFILFMILICLMIAGKCIAQTNTTVTIDPYYYLAVDFTSGYYSVDEETNKSTWESFLYPEMPEITNDFLDNYEQMIISKSTDGVQFYSISRDTYIPIPEDCGDPSYDPVAVLDASFRDPEIWFNELNHTYYMAYTYEFFQLTQDENYIPILKSKDLRNWELVTKIPTFCDVVGSPNWFIDSNNRPHLVISASAFKYNNNDTIFWTCEADGVDYQVGLIQPLVLSCSDGFYDNPDEDDYLTQWEPPIIIKGDWGFPGPITNNFLAMNHIDLVERDDGYYMFYGRQQVNLQNDPPDRGSLSVAFNEKQHGPFPDVTDLSSNGYEQVLGYFSPEDDKSWIWDGDSEIALLNREDNWDDYWQTVGVEPLPRYIPGDDDSWVGWDYYWNLPFYATDNESTQDNEAEPYTLPDYWPYGNFPKNHHSKRVAGSCGDEMPNSKDGIYILEIDEDNDGTVDKYRAYVPEHFVYYDNDSNCDNGTFFASLGSWYFEPEKNCDNCLLEWKHDQYRNPYYYRNVDTDNTNLPPDPDHLDDPSDPWYERNPGQGNLIIMREDVIAGRVMAENSTGTPVPVSGINIKLYEDQGSGYQEHSTYTTDSEGNYYFKLDYNPSYQYKIKLAGFAHTKVYGDYDGITLPVFGFYDFKLSDEPEFAINPFRTTPENNGLSTDTNEPTIIKAEYGNISWTWSDGYGCSVEESSWQYRKSGQTWIPTNPQDTTIWWAANWAFASVNIINESGPYEFRAEITDCEGQKLYSDLFYIIVDQPPKIVATVEEISQNELSDDPDNPTLVELDSDAIIWVVEEDYAACSENKTITEQWRYREYNSGVDWTTYTVFPDGEAGSAWGRWGWANTTVISNPNTLEFQVIVKDCFDQETIGTTRYITISE